MRLPGRIEPGSGSGPLTGQTGGGRRGAAFFGAAARVFALARDEAREGAFFAVDFLAVDFLAVDFFAIDFLAVDFFVVDFLADDALVVVRVLAAGPFFAAPLADAVPDDWPVACRLVPVCWVPASRVNDAGACSSRGRGA